MTALRQFSPVAARRLYRRLESFWHPYTFVTESSAGYVSGLGNKLFVLATAAAYASKHGYELVVEQTDRWGVALNGKDHEHGKTYRRPDLPHSIQELLPAFRFESRAFIQARFQGSIEDEGVRYSQGESVALHARRNVELRGYFLSHKYFTGCRDEVVRLFTFPEAVRAHVEKTYGACLAQQPVGIHVRRGDRATDPSAHLRDYYSRAMRLFPATTLFVVVSDDTEYCRKQLFSEHLAHGGRMQFVEGEQQYVDLLILTRCAGQIIADSTFSWWGGFLCPRFPDNVVICPPTCWLNLPHWKKLERNPALDPAPARR